MVDKSMASTGLHDLCDLEYLLGFFASNTMAADIPIDIAGNHLWLVRVIYDQPRRRSAINP